MFQFFNKILDATVDGFNATQKQGKGIDVVLNPILKFVKGGIKTIWNGLKAICNTLVYGYKKYNQDKPASDEALNAISAQSSEAISELGDTATAVVEFAAASTGFVARQGYDHVLCPLAITANDHVVEPAVNAVNHHVIMPAYTHLVQKPMQLAASAAHSLSENLPQIPRLRVGA